MELGDPFENEQRIGNFILLPYREIKEKKEKEKEEEHWILSWRPEFLRMEIDGAMIPVATPWDGMAVSTFKQLAKWIMILEPMPMKIQPWPTVLNAAWKSNDREIMMISFGASVIGNRDARNQIIKFREKVDLENHHLFPRDDHGNLVKNQAPWQYGNYAETNTWFHLVSQIPELPIKTCAIITKNQKLIACCENCKMIMKHRTPMILPHSLGY